MAKAPAAASEEFRRITTEYVAEEDRVRLSGELANGQGVVVWLTQRLVRRLVSVLLQRLEGQAADLPRAQVMQSFAQQAARAELSPQTPVRPAANSVAWLVRSVDIKQAPQALVLTFKGGDRRQAAILVLKTRPLRHWLNMLLDVYLKAEWPLDIWPSWILEETRPVRPPTVTLH